MVFSILFFGYKISAYGIVVDDSKVAAIRNWPTPTSITEVRSFHGLVSFYRCFVKGFSTIMAPFTNCMREKTFVWTSAAESAFQIIKDKLTSAPVLVLPNFSIPFKLHCDASKVGIGSVLSQQGHPVAFFSEKLTTARTCYNTYDFEFYVVVQAVRHWRHYLFHQEFILFTNH